MQQLRAQIFFGLQWPLWAAALVVRCFAAFALVSHLTPFGDLRDQCQKTIISSSRAETIFPAVFPDS